MATFSTIPGLTDRSASFGAQPGLAGGVGLQDTNSGGFGGALTRALGESGRAGETSLESRARKSAEEFVSMALVQPILSQLRDTNQAAAPFAPGRGERMFGGLWDAEIAQRVTSSQRFELVDIVARQLLRQTHVSAESAPQSKGVAIDA